VSDTNTIEFNDMRRISIKHLTHIQSEVSIDIAHSHISYDRTASPAQNKTDTINANKEHTIFDHRVWQIVPR